MNAILLHLLPATLYAGLGLHFWRTRWRESLVPARGLQPWERLLILATLALHGAGLFLDVFPGAGMRFGFGVAAALTLWLAVLFYWLESWSARLEGLHMLVLPAAAFAALLPAFFPGQHEPANVASTVFRAHFIVAMLAYSLFTLAALHALLMAATEKRLHRGRVSRALANLPPLLTMEALLFRLIGVGFVLLTLTVVSGVFFSEALFGRPFSFNHKTVFAIASWLIFAGLLAGRMAYGWRGRTALRWTLAGFLTLVLAYIGSRFVLEVILGRG